MRCCFRIVPGACACVVVSAASGGDLSLSPAKVFETRAPQIVVQVREGISANRAIESFRAAVGARQAAQIGLRSALDSSIKDFHTAQRLGLDRYYIVDLPHDMSESFALGVFSRIPEVERAETQGVGSVHSNDPLFPQQWHLKNTGQNGGTPGADMRGSSAWYAFSSYQPVVVAVLDTGVSLSHPDLSGRLVAGRNFLGSDPNAYDDSTSASHGTYCAGIAAAVYNNSIGVAGVSPNARIMPVRVTSGVVISQTTVGNGLMWAADNGARIASMSLSFPVGSTVSFLQSAVQYAAQGNPSATPPRAPMVLVASSGNTPGVPIGYPAAWPEVIAVGATDNNDVPFSAQTTGPELDLVAPGVDILTTTDITSNQNGYSTQTGTSMACPMVAATAALVWGVNPALTAAEVRSIIETTVDDRGPTGWDVNYGLGRLNATAAVVKAMTTLPCAADFNKDGVVNVTDLYNFLSKYFVGDLAADVDQSGTVTVGDLFSFLSNWFAGCPR